MAKRNSVEADLQQTPSKRTRRARLEPNPDELALNGVSDDGISEAQEDISEPEELLEEPPQDDPEPQTPSKRKRGRRAAREETPPQNLPPNERYFWDNRPGGSKTSNNTLTSHLLLNHDEYFEFNDSFVDPHRERIEYLHSLHESAFDQWEFELRNRFNLCLYGYGSKRGIMGAFAEYLYDASTAPDTTTTTPKSKSRKRVKAEEPKIVLVNGYEPTITLRDILTTIAGTFFPSHLKLPAQPAALQQLILGTLTENPPPKPLYILVNSLDSQSLRRSTTQSSLAAFAAHPAVRLVVTCDTPNFPLLWDTTLRRKFQFLFHDCTTFAPYEREIDVVETVNELLGRSGRRVGGRDGVGYVLKSLPENARNLYRILVAEQVAAGIEGAEDAGDEDDGGVKAGASVEGIEYRVLYHKAREELVCSTEHQFRTLLNEFYDHQMLESRRDTVGTERLVVPFRQEELEGLLEDLME
jgi:origin recognition complex subunit 2